MITGLIFFDGGRFHDQSSPGYGPNRTTLYQNQSIPNFGFVFAGLERRLNASGFNYYANMNREIPAGGVTGIFEDRTLTYIPRGALNGVTGDLVPVLIMNLVSSDFAVTGFYNVQPRNEVSGDTSRKEIWPSLRVEVVKEV